jgi:hypothetical protein
MRGSSAVRAQLDVASCSGFYLSGVITISQRATTHFCCFQPPIKPDLHRGAVHDWRGADFVGRACRTSNRVSVNGKETWYSSEYKPSNRVYGTVK